MITDVVDSLAVLRRLERDYEKLRESLSNADELVLVATRVEKSKPLETSEAAILVANQSKRSGWARYRSGPVLFPAETDELPTDLGPALSGEWAVSDDESIHFRQSPDEPGLFVVWTYTERPLGPSDHLAAAEQPMLRQRVVTLACPEGNDERNALKTPKRGSRQRVAIYHVFWAGTPDDPHAIGRRFARFAGFAHEERARWIAKNQG